MAFDPIAYALAKKKANAYTDTAISLLGSGMKYKGNVASQANLPLTGNTKGDVYTTSNDGAEYVWTSASATGTLTDWLELGKAYTVTIDI